MRRLSLAGTVQLMSLLMMACGADVMAASNGDVLESRPYVLAAWDSLANPARYIARPDYDRARANRSLELRRVVYSSDGLRVSAIVATSRQGSSRNRPLIVFVRGSYLVGDVGWQYAPLMDRLVSEGFTVVAPMLRQSDGGEGRDELGGADLADVLHTLPLAHALGAADTSRVFLYGESRGGVMAFEALKAGFPARAAATFGAFTDLDSLIVTAPERYAPLTKVLWPDFAERHTAITDARSAARWSNWLRAPLLLMHGGNDGDVPPQQTVALAARLEQDRAPYRVMIFGGQQHTLRGVAAERDSMVAAWFRRVLPAAGAGH